MILESKINSLDFSEDQNSVQVLINELERIKAYPHKQHLIAVKTCAQHMAKYQVIEKFEKKKGIYYNYDKKLWYAEKMVKGKLIVIKYSADRNECVLAYDKFVNSI